MLVDDNAAATGANGASAAGVAGVAGAAAETANTGEMATDGEAGPANKRKINPFIGMMNSREVHHKPDPKDKRPIISRPRGPAPKGKMWDRHEGWVDDPSYTAPPPAAKRPVGRPPKAAAPVAAEDEADSDASDSESAPTLPSRRMFQSSWKTILPWLIFSLGVGVTVKQMDTEASQAIKFICPTGGEACPGCNHCGTMQCTLCMERGTSGASAAGSLNPFVAGCCRFHIESVRDHATAYHANEIGNAGQSGISAGFVKQINDHRAYLKRIFGNVYWLAKEKIALRKLPSLCALSGFQGLPLGRSYLNHVMGRDMVLSIASILREDINQLARISPTLGLMVDESTDVASTNSMVLYLRLLGKGGVFTTVFWGIVEVTEATADGLFSVRSGGSHKPAVKFCKRRRICHDRS